jgi:eukaryotic-like serine/threonine-protein kinase
MPRRDDALRELLFGLLSSQNGMVNQPQLVAAFGAWTTTPGRAMADLLVEQGALTPRRREVLEALVAEYVAAHGGDPGDSLEALEVSLATREGLARVASLIPRASSDRPAHPGGGDEDGFDLRSNLERLLANGTPTGPGGVLDTPDTTRTSTLADITSRGEATTGSMLPADASARRFRLLRAHARGGLGAVFVALDAELNREVALKQILEKHADDPSSQRRFLLEAEITGGLEHPGIVPVYSLGRYEDGRPYYAMRLISGETLKEAIDHDRAELGSRQGAPTEDAGSTARSNPNTGSRDLRLLKLLRRFLDVCNAVDYAHSRGVLHRDLKPGNVIVGRYGETLVLDWGLAKATGRSDPSAGEHTLMPRSGGSSETLPGSAMGTPAYMSPEQASGDLDRLGPRSDVYSLGATLYCLLTGRPPFEGRDAGEVLGAVRRGEFAPPRRHDPTIDVALEAVCLKAMATRPEDRYATARALVEDLERWLADEPVTAWREPMSRRARRWARRNRTAVTAAAVGLVAAVMGLSAVLAVQTQAKARITQSLNRETAANEALAVTNGKLTDANEELGRSKAAVQARYDLAVAAIKTFHTGVSEDFLMTQDQFHEVRDGLLKSAADFYGKLGALLGKETDPASRRALAASNFELAELTAKVGRQDEALAAHRAVLTAREALAAELGDDDAAMTDVGRSLTAVASILEATGRTEEALSACRRSESLLAGRAEASPAARAALAADRSRLGGLLCDTGQTDAALKVYRQARADQETLAAAPGATSDAQHDLALTINRIAVLLVETGKSEDAEAEYRRALEIRKKLANDNPGVTEFRSRLAAIHGNLGAHLSETGRLAEAEAEFRKALEIDRRLAHDHAAVAEFRSRLADGHDRIGWILLAAGKLGGEAEFRKALEIQERLVADNLAVTKFRTRLAATHDYLGNLLVGLGRLAEAEAEFRKALEIRQELADDHPEVTEFRSDLARSHRNLGELLNLAGKPGEAEPELRRALAMFLKLAADNPGLPYNRDVVAQVHTNLSIALRRLGRPAEALEQCDRAVAIREALVKEQPKTTRYRAGLAEGHLNRGLSRRDLGDRPGAATDVRHALGLFGSQASRRGTEWFLFACVRAALAGLGDRPGSGVSAAEAASEAEAAMNLLHEAVAAGYRDPDTYRREDALDPLRARTDFRLLLMDLAMPTEPFAAAR